MTFDIRLPPKQIARIERGKAMLVETTQTFTGPFYRQSQTAATIRLTLGWGLGARS